MPSLTVYIKIDPIVAELLKAGICTYKKHFKIYFFVNLLFIILFLLILGIQPSWNMNLKMLDQLYLFFNSFHNYTQTIYFYGIIGLLITILTYYLTFNQTLSSGELGLEIPTRKISIYQFSEILIFNLLVLTYFLTWVFFYRLVVDALILSLLKKYPLEFPTDYLPILGALFLDILLLGLLFLCVVKLAYYTYMLDKFNVPKQALVPIIFFFGSFFGLLILILDIVTLSFPSFWVIAVIITYLTPGTVLMPILGYLMAHLKVASTALSIKQFLISNNLISS